MNKLGELDYTILTLYYFECKSLKEIARTMPLLIPVLLPTFHAAG
jgi:DNA-directed RNA polymerase specialized sigma subunit